LSDPLTIIDIVPHAFEWKVKNKATWAETGQKFDLNPNTLRGRWSDWCKLNGHAPEASPEDIEAETLTLAEKIQKLMELKQEIEGIVDPVITHQDIDLKTQQPVAILLAGCMQLGGRWTFDSLIRTKFEECLSLERTYIGLFGDEIENFYSGSFAGAKSVYDQLITPDLQRVQWDAYLDRIQDRALWGLASQHGTIWDERKAGYVPIKQTYLSRGIPFFDGQAYVTLHVGKQRYKLAVAHEFPGNSMWNPNHGQKRALWQRFPLADVVAMADKHQYSIQEFMYGNNEYLAGDKASPFVYLVQIGTAKGGPDPYSIRGWERGQTEWPWVVLWPDEHKVKVTRHFEDVAHWLGEDDPAGEG